MPSCLDAMQLVASAAVPEVASTDAAESSTK